MEEELMQDLGTELAMTDENYNEALLRSKVKAAMREVRTARRYPSHYSDEMKERDMAGFYSQCRAIALYDYSLVGAEGQETSTENGVSRSYVDRKTLFGGVIALAR